MSGTDDAIRALLARKPDDPSPVVGERAACGLAESGMLTPSREMRAVPQLLADSGDPALDAADPRAGMFGPWATSPISSRQGIEGRGEAGRNSQ